MSNLNDLMVRIGGDVEPLNTSLKKGSDNLKKFGKGAASQAKNIALMTTAATAAASAIGIGLTKSSIDAAKEIKNLSSVANTATDVFQRHTFAAKTVGIEQEKLADIYKDVSDKVGDFLVTGAGPMVDYFEQVAPLIGDTAEEFKNLSGADALQRYVDGLQKANLSQEKMVFFMEAIASDATALLPLLRDNGSEMKRLSEQADNLNLVLSSTDIKNLSAAGSAISRLGDQIETTGQKFAAEFSPAVEAAANVVSEKFAEAYGSMEDGVGLAADAAINAFANVIEHGATLVEFVENNKDTATYGLLGYMILGKKGLAVGAAVGTVVDSVTGHLERMGLNAGESVDATANRIKFLEEQLVSLQATMDFNASRDRWDLYEHYSEQATLLQAELQDLKDAFSDNDEASQALDDLLAGEAEGAGKLAQSMREVAAAMRDAKNAKDELNGEGDDASGGDDAVDSPATVESEGNAEEDPRVKYAKNVTSALKLEYGNEVKAAARAEEEKAEVRALYQQENLSSMSSMFGDLTSLMDTENKKQFEIGKLAARAQVATDTIASAQSAYKSLAGIPVVGPGLGAAAAVAATVAGMKRMRQVESMSMNSGAPAPVSGGTVGGIQGSAGQSGQQFGATQSVSIEGIDPSMLYSGAAVRGMADELVQLQKDGYNLVPSS